MKSALIPTMGVTLYTNPPPPPKILKLVIGVRSGCTLTKEKPTGTSIFGYSCATEIRDDTNHNASIYRPNRLFIFQLLEYGDDQSSASRRYFVFAAPQLRRRRLLHGLSYPISWRPLLPRKETRRSPNCPPTHEVGLWLVTSLQERSDGNCHF